MHEAALSRVEAGVAVRLRVTPRGGRDRIDGMQALADGREVMAVRVTSAPADGEANAALCDLMARAAGVPRSAVRVGAGATSRVKRLVITGDPDAIETRLRAAAAAGRGR